LVIQELKSGGLLPPPQPSATSSPLRTKFVTDRDLYPIQATWAVYMVIVPAGIVQLPGLLVVMAPGSWGIICFLLLHELPGLKPLFHLVCSPVIK
jgi:hypothetical protein